MPALILALLALSEGNPEYARVEGACLTVLAPQSIDERERLLREDLARHRAAKPADAGPALDAWDRREFDLEWEYGVLLYKLAEERQTKPLYEQVVRHFTDFIWKRDDYLAALQARIYLGRAHQALEQWGQCFTAFAQARLTEKPEHRSNPEMVEIATRSIIAELRARVAYRRGLEISLQEAQTHLKRFAPQKENPLFLALRVELGRLLHALRRWGDAEKVLREVWAGHAGEDAGEAALESLAAFFPRADYQEPLAEIRFGQHRFTEAVILYRDLPRAPRVWFRIGLCYAHLRRVYEAVEALQEACAKDHPDRPAAAVRLERLLNHLAAEGDAELRPRLARHRAWMVKTLDLSNLGPLGVRDLADSHAAEGDFRKAAELYAKIKPGEDGHEEAVRAAGYCRLRLKEYDKAAEALVGYLGFAKRTPRGTDTALDWACRALVELGRPEEVLDLTDRVRAGDPALAEWRLAHRVDALGRLGRFKEAHETLASMKETVALNPSVRALERLAVAYEAALRKDGDKKLWAPYARLVVALSEKTFQPLRGEKLLAAADALVLEGTPEASGMAFDLYGQYLLDPGLRADERRPVIYRRATAGLAAGRHKEALALATELLLADPVRGSYRELQGDILAGQAASMPRGGERNQVLDEALAVFGRLFADLKPRPDEHFYRVAEKYAGLLFLRDPERAAAFLANLEKMGHRDKMVELKRKVNELVPPRRR